MEPIAQQNERHSSACVASVYVYMYVGIPLEVENIKHYNAVPPTLNIF